MGPTPSSAHSPDPPTLDPWAAILVLLAAAAGFAAVVFGGHLAHRLLVGPFPPPTSPGALVLQALAHLGGAAAAIATAWTRQPAIPPIRLVFPGRSPGAPALGLGFAAGLGLQLPLAELGNVVAEVAPPSPAHQALLRELASPATPEAWLATFLATVVAAPLAEEAVFRGLLVASLARTVGAGAAIIASTVGFALVHGHPTAVAYAGAAGLVLGGLVVASRGVLLGVAVHAGVNALPLLLPGTVTLPGVGPVDLHAPHLPAGAVASGSLLAIAGLGAALGLSRRRHRPSRPPPPGRRGGAEAPG